MSENLFPGVALITGAAGTGIGAATAKAFAAAGCKCIAITDRNAELLQATADAITTTHSDVAVHTVVGDVSDEASVNSFVDGVVQKFGRIDYAVNCAGVRGLAKKAIDTALDEFERLNNINYKGVFLTSRAEVSAMLKQPPLPSSPPSSRPPQRGAIVNIASQLGIVGKAKQGTYCASKAAVIAMTRSDAIDYAKDGIRINCVCPGVIDTPMTVWDERSRDDVEPWVQMAPLGRIGRPEEIAERSCFCALRRRVLSWGMRWLWMGVIY